MDLDRTLWTASRLGAAVLTAGTVGWVAVTRWDTLLAGHPAYPVTLAVAALTAAALTVRAATGRPRDGRVRTVAGSAAWVLGALVVAVFLGWLRPFPATAAAVAALRTGDGVTVRDTATRFELRPTTTAPPRAGLVFYPGARVDTRAYAALLRQVARAGYLVVVVKEPYGIGFAGADAADAAIAAHPEVTRWAVGGHSLGGVVAAGYAGQHREAVRGLLLWASYPSGSLASADLAVTSVSGTRDGLTTPDDVAASRARLPAGTDYVVLDGAVHAYFGDYGDQPGDGTPTVPRGPAQDRVVRASSALLARVAG